jgi:hypothetical protein
MPVLFQYLLKLSISLAAVYLFYHLVLRRLTFYHWNRWYLLAYGLLSFLFPLIDITPVLQQQDWSKSSLVELIPLIQVKADGTTIAYKPGGISAWTIAAFLFYAGLLLMVTRLTIQLISFSRLRKRAQYIPGEGPRIYQVDEPIIPFSFGNAIYINCRQHNDEELREIIRHEFVHVRQHHSFDIICCEILCILNWYNPFAWMMRKAVRQNLEFIADHQVIGSGINRKDYQYLLLKVIGNNQFSIAPKFNFSSLKKRIAMMNKMKTAQVHLFRFLFILPLLAVLLLSFRKYQQVHSANGKWIPKVNDTVPVKPPPPPPPPPPKDPGVADNLPVVYEKFEIKDKKARIQYKNGTVENYDFTIPEDKARFELKFGTMLSVDNKISMTAAVMPGMASMEGNVVVAPVIKGIVTTTPLITTTISPAIIAAPSIEGLPVTGVVATTIPGSNGLTAIVPTGLVTAPAIPKDFPDEITMDDGFFLTITSQTTRQQLEDLKKQAKERDVELTIDDTEYENNQLVRVTGTLKSKDGSSNFVATDFRKLVLVMWNKDGKIIFRVIVKDKNEVM